MTNREQIIKHLKGSIAFIQTFHKRDLSFKSVIESMEDAISLLMLEEAEPPQALYSIRDIEELQTYWIEDRETGRCLPETILAIDDRQEGNDVYTIPAVRLTNGYAPVLTKRTEGYNSKTFTGWRCWKKEPTEEQRKAVKWGD